MRYSTYGAALLLPLFSALSLAAAEPAPVATAATTLAPAGPKPLTFDDGKGVFDFSERLRFENRRDNFDFNVAVHSPTDDSWLVQRFRAGLTWKLSPDLSLQVQVQDAREWGSERPKVPFILGAEGNDTLNLHLASLTIGDPKKSPVVFTLGRQTILLGEERLVGASEWNNFGRVFDAAKAVWNVVPGRTTATVFLSSVVNVGPANLGDGWKFDSSSTANDLFSGVYVSQKLDQACVLDGYLFWRNKKDNDPIYSAQTISIPAPARTAAAYDIGQDVFTLGTRYLAPPKEGEFDSEFEGALQWGSVNRQTTTATGPYGGTSGTLDQKAWALHTLVGYTPRGLPGKLRLDVEYNVASGDTSRTDGENNSFMNLFPSNHKFYGFMDVFAWKNLREFVATARFTPLPKTVVRIDYHRFSLYTSQDAWYRANGVATVRPLNAAAQAAPTHAGDELDFTATWTPRPWAVVDAGFARFAAGAYLGATGARSDANFLYVQTTLKY